MTPSSAKRLDWFWNLNLFVTQCLEVTISAKAEGDLGTLRKECWVNKENHTELPKIILTAPTPSCYCNYRNIFKLFSEELVNWNRKCFNEFKSFKNLYETFEDERFLCPPPLFIKHKQALMHFPSTMCILFIRLSTALCGIEIHLFKMTVVLGKVPTNQFPERLHFRTTIFFFLFELPRRQGLALISACKFSWGVTHIRPFYTSGNSDAPVSWFWKPR